MCLGSARAMTESSEAEGFYQVREEAPDILLLANLGIQQIGILGIDRITRLVEKIHADGLCIHLNNLMELMQNEKRQQSFQNIWHALRCLANLYSERLIVKEVGCGISREVAKKLADLGVQNIDVAGSGGTCWTRAELYRMKGMPAGMSEFIEWGIPTAASLCDVRNLHLHVIASGGIWSGLDVAKALSLGAHMASAALPFARAAATGISKLEEVFEEIASGLRIAMVLTGSCSVNELRRARIVLTGPLFEWHKQMNDIEHIPA